MLADLRPALVVTRREMRDHFRDWRILGPILLLVLILPFLMNYTSVRFLSLVEEYGARIEIDQLFPFLLMVVGFFPITVALVLALESFVGEKERRSIEPLLSSPLSDFQIYMGKFLAAVVPPLLASYLGMGLYLLMVYYRGNWFPDVGTLLQIFALATTNCLIMVSAAVVVSSQTTSMRAANLMAVFIILPMAVLLQAESAVIVWARDEVLFWTVVGQVIISILLVRIGIAHFNREELISREFDSLDLRWGLASFWSQFRGQANSPLDWYKKEIKNELIKIRLPVLLVMIILIGGVLLGVNLADRFVIPPELIEMDAITTGSIEGFESVSLFESGSVPTVWFHNLRTMALASLAGIFSFGVLALIVMLLPVLLIGYFTATMAGVGLSPLLFLLGFVIPHGILEIPAIIFAGAAILRFGAAIATPSSGKTFGEAMVVGMADWAKVMVGLVLPLLLGAAFLEVAITPRIASWIIGG